MEILDALDAALPDNDAEAFAAGRYDAATVERAKAVRARIEAVNAAIYESIRSEVGRGTPPAKLLHWIRLCRSGTPELEPGLGYDHLDELIRGVLPLAEPEGAVAPGPEMVFYQPTPARHILALIEASGLCEDDVLVDLGSGLGHVPMVASMLTGARAIGIEVDPAYVQSARECAALLGLEGVSFADQDAREADLSAGTVFHLYTPFSGGMLRAVLGRLRREGEKRTIRVCTLGPCATTVANEGWLRADGAVDAERITCFRSHPKRKRRI